jgi:DnaJ-class molecular chaperone
MGKASHPRPILGRRYPAEAYRSRKTGDMYVEVVVETPQKLTKHQRELLSEFEECR